MLSNFKNKLINSGWFQMLIYSQNWNIGFPQVNIESIVKGEKFEIKWLKHPYRDRFFADPFIYSVSEKEIVILAEELIFKENKGRIVRLVVGRKDYRLIKRSVVLEKDSHLSYPALLELNGDVFIYPENGASGELTLYKYNGDTCAAQPVNVIYNGALADATIMPCDNGFLMFATETSHHDIDLRLYYCGNPLIEKFEKGDVIYMDKNGARSAGGILNINGQLYRPAQDCTTNYGGALTIQELKLDGIKISLNNCISIQPKSNKYSLGIHTLNHKDGVCVVDGYGYLHPFIGKLLSLKKSVFLRDNN